MIIGLVGKAGSGKDSVASHLCETHGFIRHAFADKLKDTIAELFHMSNTQLYSQDEKEKIDDRYGITPRRLLQYFGTDVCRKIYPDIWVDFVLREYDILCEHRKEAIRLSEEALQDAGANSGAIKLMPTEPVRLVIPDVRFSNEAEKIRNKDGLIWKIVCPNNPKTEKLAEDANHASETESDAIEVDYTFTARYGELRGLYVRLTRYFNVLMRELERIERTGRTEKTEKTEEKP